MKVIFRILFILIISALTFTACSSYRNISKQNVAYLYSDAAIILQPEYVIFHSTNDSSKVYFRINTNELLYTRNGFLKNFMAQFTVKYEVFAGYNSPQILDSASIFYTDTVGELKNRFFTDNFSIRLLSGHKYVLKITALDNNRAKSFVSFINVNKENQINAQNFVVTNPNNEPVYERYFKKGEYFNINYKNDSLKFLIVKYYKNKFKIATPPFHIQSGKTTTIYPDSIFVVKLTNGSTPLLKLPNEGIYRFMADTGHTESLTMFCFHEDFPLITLPDQMLNSARYLTTRQEFDNMIIRADKKEAIDDFWLNIAGNPDRARKLIKSYYSRVQLANKYFTSYQEGWKTDRGMIYIIYGPPATVYKSSTYENWIYGDASTLKSLNFMFYNVENPFTENDFMLSKSELFRDSWYYAVSNWRR